MVTVMTLMYVGIVVVLFRFKLVKPHPVPIALTAVVGFLLIGSVVIAWRQFAPMTPRVVTTQYVVQLVPYVKGQVKKIYAQPNQLIKQGEPLLDIDPIPYQNAADQATAQPAIGPGERQANRRRQGLGHCERRQGRRRRQPGPVGASTRGRRPSRRRSPGSPRPRPRTTWRKRKSRSP